jgi:hypothetical protein
MAHEDDVIAAVVQRAVRLVGDPNAAQLAAAIERERLW